MSYATLFQKIAQDGEAALEAFCANRMQEGVDLEFKRKTRSENGDFEKADRQVLGKVLSAFANSAGGLLVFGVDAKRGADGVDAADALFPIKDIAKFYSEANTLIGQLLLPRHDGVQIHAVPSFSNAGAGYLLVAVDRSERRPHQSKAPEDGRYYKRVGDNTFVMEHYDVEDSFRRNISPSLSVGHSIQSGMSYGGAQGRIHVARLTISVLVEDGVARSPFFHLIGTNGAQVVPANEAAAYGITLRQTSISGETRFDGQGNDVFHNGISYPVAILNVEVLVQGEAGPVTIGGTPAASALINVHYRVGAEGAHTQRSRLDVPGREIASQVGLLR